jgi:hypothetical protein
MTSKFYEEDKINLSLIVIFIFFEYNCIIK